MEKTTVVLNLEKETPNKQRYKEETPAGKPPIIESIYLPKWFAGKAASIKVTIEEVK